MKPDHPLHIGCPKWSEPAWKGEFLPAKTKPDEFLEHYSRALNSVEGNTAFYALPKIETAKRWATSVERGFQFCFKVPRTISHGAGLMEMPPAMRDFFSFLDVFAESQTLGPTFLQLHANFHPKRLAELQTFLQAWPSELPLAVEVRNHDFFVDGQARERFEDLLREHGADRVIFDSRALFQAPPTDAAEQAAQGRKPNPPVHWTTTGERPFVRFVAGSDLAKSDQRLNEVVHRTQQWIAQGKHPYTFFHTPNPRDAPKLCERFHKKLQQQIPSLPALDLSAAKGDQRELF